MITEEEKEDIINKATERTLLRIPEIVGNLISNHAARLRINAEFYDKYPEFKEYKTIVASSIEEVEGSFPLKDYRKVIEESIPKIRRRISELKNLDMKKVDKPDLTKIDFGQGEI